MNNSYRKLSDYLVNSAYRGLTTQEADGSMPEGHNGPWNNRDTKVRTTAHWALTFYKSFNLTDDEQFLSAAKRSCEYLLQEDLRPNNAAYYCRYKEHRKTQSNGLIGQAWAVEPLITIGNALNETRYLDIADNILNLHPYDVTTHCWKGIEVDGSILEDSTLNHQLYFCAIAALYVKTIDDTQSELYTSIKDFLEYLPGLIQISKEGLFGHNMFSTKVSLRYKIIKPFESILLGKPSYSLNYISLGYHSYVIYCLSLIKEVTSNHPLWEDRSFREMIITGCKYAEKKLSNIPMKKNVFAYGYNPTGLEMAYAISVFSNYFDKTASLKMNMNNWCKLQFTRHYDTETGLMDKNTTDPVLLSSRIYEAVSIPDLDL